MPLQNAGIPSAGGGTIRHTCATGTATAVTGNACRSVQIKALSTNADTVYIGFSAAGAASSLGFELNGGDQIGFDLDNTNRIYALGASGTQYLCITYSI